VTGVLTFLGAGVGLVVILATLTLRFTFTPFHGKAFTFCVPEIIRRWLRKIV
jgi:hypothetical protein